VAAKVVVEEYRGKYNNKRPRSSLGYLTPAEFARGRDLGNIASAMVGGLVTEVAWSIGRHTAGIPTLS
jgi:hypothetical protein